MTVGEMLDRMSSYELTEWMAYYALEPFGVDRDNLHAGIVAKAVYDVAIQEPSARAKIKATDFILKVGEEETKPDDGMTVLDKARVWAAINKGA